MTRKIVIQTDFGLSDGAVSAMYGVAFSVDPTLQIFDLTHDIPQYNIWEGSYRLYQTINYWPEETVFISVVDPGVGSDRLSVVVKTDDHQYIVTPDNGTLTHIKENIGIKEARIIDESVNSLPQSGESYTFHGREVYAYTGARLAAQVISFEEIGPKIDVIDLIELPQKRANIEEDAIIGTIDILDVRFGNLWTNIDRHLFDETEIEYGELLEVMIINNEQQVYKNIMRFGQTFADTKLGEPLLFVNSVEQIGVAINQGSFAKAYRIGTGLNWQIVIRKASNIVFNT